MKTLAVIIYDVVNKQVESDMLFPLHDALNHYDELTEEYEKRGWFFVKEHKIDTYTIVREFATKNSGHVFDLILCGGMVEGPITLVK